MTRIIIEIEGHEVSSSTVQRKPCGCGGATTPSEATLLAQATGTTDAGAARLDFVDLLASARGAYGNFDRGISFQATDAGRAPEEFDGPSADNRK